MKNSRNIWNSIYGIKLAAILITFWGGAAVVLALAFSGRSPLPLWALVAIWLGAVLIEFLFFLQFHYLDNMDEEENKEDPKEGS